ncbi:MAG: hypothetical protein HY589_00335, partial [Candidatus Omnitrophica bacterium]|nr:hypothetical protein [Candidatus Omnitrophota bacterium]
MSKKFFFLSFTLFALSFTPALADTVYLTNGATEKGLVVEEYYDRFLFSTTYGEKEIPKADIDEVFFDEPYQNNLYIGRKFEDIGEFDKALQFYQLSLQSNGDFKEAADAIKGIEDARWRFKKQLRYRELKETLAEQLGIKLKLGRGGRIVVREVYEAADDNLKRRDVLVKCWARPLTRAGLKNASGILIGLSNTILKVTIERDIEVKTSTGKGLKPSSAMAVDMGPEGPVVRFVKKEGPFYVSGVREGDLITGIGYDSARYIKLSDIKKRIFGGAKSVILTVRREIALMRKRPVSRITNAMWVWDSKEILLNNTKKNELLDFSADNNIRVLFFQLQYQLTDRAPAACGLLYEGRLRAFLKDAHSRGIAVHALDGWPDFCLEPNHPLVLAQIKAILEFNKASSGQERFDGAHYDNEPYLLPGFNAGLKQDIIRQYLELNRKCRELISSNGTRLEFGIDIPFWFDELDGLHAKLIDISDNIGVMDYRNFAEGPDGMIRHALDELKYASKAGKKVYIGVETSRYPAREIYFVSAGEKAPDAGILLSSRFEGFPLVAHPFGKQLYIGLAKAEGADGKAFNNALDKLGGLFGRIEKPPDEKAFGDIVFDVTAALSSNPEFRDVDYKEYARDKAFLLFSAREVMLEKLTFYGFGEKDMGAVLAEARKGFEDYPAFAGFALHHY